MSRLFNKASLKFIQNNFELLNSQCKLSKRDITLWIYLKVLRAEKYKNEVKFRSSLVQFDLTLF